MNNLDLLAAEGKPHIAPAVSASDIRSYSLTEFLSLAIPPRKQMLSPWLPEKGLVMIFAARGVGKTFMSLSAAYAVATGGEFLGLAHRRPGEYFISTVK